MDLWESLRTDPERQDAFDKTAKDIAQHLVQCDPSPRYPSPTGR
jgi:hypothetical protein